MQQWSRVRTPRSGKGTESVERLLKLILGRELCTHDSRFSGDDRAMPPGGHWGSVFAPSPFQALLLLSV